MSLFNSIGNDNRDEGNDFVRQGFADSYALYTFDLSLDLTDNESFNLARHGTVRVDLTFGVAPPNTVTVRKYNRD